MAIQEKRKNPRVHTVNLISYTGLGDKGDSKEQGKGKALDIGQGGMLIETNVPIEARHILLTAMDTNEKPMKIKGRVIYCREEEPNIFHAGIRFEEPDNRIREIVIEMIKAFLETKKG